MSCVNRLEHCVDEVLERQPGRLPWVTHDDGYSATYYCDVCEDGFYWEGTMCHPCEIDNCELCSDFDICTLCADDFILEPFLGECRPYFQNCVASYEEQRQPDAQNPLGKYLGEDGNLRYYCKECDSGFFFDEETDAC